MAPSGLSRGLRSLVALGTLLAVCIGGSPEAAGAAANGIQPDIVNLGHLDALHATVTPAVRLLAGHTTTDADSPIDTWWVYANFDSASNTYTPTGGGTYDASTNTYAQGAFDTDDVARAAIVYLTHYRYYGDQHSLQLARGALRFVLYMQTASGPQAGNFVLWMQPDGTLNPTPTPPDSPNPADTGASYWLARSLWALGEGFATFKSTDPAFASVLRDRMELAMARLDHELVQPNLGQFYTLHGYRTPKWFIADGADASSEAMLGLSAYYAATGSPEAERLAVAFGNGIAGFQLGTVQDWPWQALMPYARSLSDWHAWGAHMAMALATSAALPGRDRWLAAAERNANSFDTHLLVSFGPINGLLPAPDDISQIAYGAETTSDGLLFLGQATGKRVYRELGGIAASWFFGNNPANTAMYQPATGVVFDGINADGTVNRNSGAESTIHGLLAVMNAINDPVARRYLDFSHVAGQSTYQKVEAESGTLSGTAQVITPAAAWTGEAQWSNGAYVDLAAGGSDSVVATGQTDGHYAVSVVFDKQMGAASSVGVRVSVDGAPAGTDPEGGAGVQGDSPNPDYLTIDTVRVPRRLEAGPHTVRLDYAGEPGGHARIDAILLQPLVESRVLTDGEQATLAVYRSLDSAASSGALPAVQRSTSWAIRMYNRDGELVADFSLQSNARSSGRAPVAPLGYTLALAHAAD